MPKIAHSVMWNVLYFVQRSSIHTIRIRAPLALVVVAVVAIETIMVRRAGRGPVVDPFTLFP